MADCLAGSIQPGSAPFNAPAALADLNGDSQLTVVDLVILLEYLAGHIPSLPV